MSVAINKWGYRLQYNNYFGGVTAISRDQFANMNGYANTFYGWGGEDDDLHHRIQQLNLTINRSPVTISRFFMQLHGPVKISFEPFFREPMSQCHKSGTRHHQLNKQ